MQSRTMLMFASALFGAGMALAQSATQAPPQEKPPRFLAKFNERFIDADKNGDGALSKPEAEQAQMGRVVDNFERLDADKDGKVTREEIRALVRNRLSS
jgi:Ca2+-binding EF-hand superfamily protein